MNDLAATYPVWKKRVFLGESNGYLPKDFPFIVDDTNEQIFEPALFYIENQCVASNGSFVYNTAHSYVQDLLDWLRYTSEAQFAWTQATWDDFVEYISGLGALISPSTGERYAQATIERRIVPILGLYRYASRSFNINFNGAPKNSLFTLEYKDELVTLKAKEKRARLRTMPEHAEDKHMIRVIQPEQMKRLLSELTLDKSYARALGISAPAEVTTYRLAVEISHHTGLRLSEVVGLRLSQFEKFRTMHIEDSRDFLLNIKRKGGAVLPAKFTGWLVRRVVAYISSERELVSLKYKSTSVRLLLNPGGQSGGRAITKRTLQRRFYIACLKSGLTRTVVKRQAVGGDWKTLKENSTQVALFRFHDLRHTYAVWAYHALVGKGHQEPWIAIQEQLGHQDVRTTMKIYLQATRQLEIMASDNFYHGLRRIISMRPLEETEYV